jgi:hypothetical protein
MQHYNYGDRGRIRDLSIRRLVLLGGALLDTNKAVHTNIQVLYSLLVISILVGLSLYHVWFPSIPSQNHGERTGCTGMSKGIPAPGTEGTILRSTSLCRATSLDNVVPARSPTKIKLNTQPE